MENGQAVTAEENLRKGARTTESVLTRAWQAQFLDKYRSHGEPDFLLAALPAAGKTRAALAVAHLFLNSPERRLIVVGPTLNIRRQWRVEARNKFGIQLLAQQFHGHLNDPSFQGVVTTYQSVASNSLVFKRLCAKYKCMIIFDEVHHAGDHATWGQAIRDAFEQAERRLSLSGTPFRSDGKKIPFLRLADDGSYLIDFAYDYPSAFHDHVIRELCFHRYAGSVTFQHDDEVFTFHTNDDLSDDDAARRLRALLGHKNYMRGFLRAAHEQLVDVRKTKPNAGALALCQTADHAVWVVSLLREITGAEPDLVVSDGDLATSSVEAFRDSDRPWVVAVRQISEGVDIPRLMVLAYATSWRTALFFRQAVGRIMRYEGTDTDTEAYCFLPTDPELIEHAETIEAFQAQVLAAQELEDGAADARIGGERSTPLVLDSSEAEFDGLINRGRQHDALWSTQIVEFARRHRITEAAASTILQELGVGAVPISEAAPDNEAELGRLAKQCNKAANRLARARGIEPRDIHRQWIKLTNSGHGKMTLIQFRQKLEWLLTQLRELGWN